MGSVPGVDSSSATAINNAGAVAGTFFDSIDHHYHAFATTGGAVVDMGTFSGGPLKGANSFAAGISGQGEVAGTARLTDGRSVVFRSATPGQASLITLPGGSNSGQAAGVNQNGAVVGSYLNAQGASRVFIANQNTAVDLLSQVTGRGFGLNMYGSAINNLGSVTGYGDYGGQYHSFLSTIDPTTGARTFTDLGTGGGLGSTVSIGLNDRGQVVGEMDNYGTNSRAFLWDQTTGVVDLNSLLSASDQKLWTLTSATGINDDGMIVGQGYFQGQLHGFELSSSGGTVASLAPSAVPAPPSVWLALVGLGMTSGWLRIRRGKTADRDAV